MADRSQNCATCGKKRRPLEARRESWSAKLPTALVPRPESPGGKAWQSVNDLILYAAVYRNGGTNEQTHLCDDCLRIGLRAIKAAVDEVLEVVEAGADKDAEIATLTQRVASLQAEVWVLGLKLENATRRPGASGDGEGRSVSESA